MDDPGPFHDAQNFARHFYYQSKREGKHNDWALLGMGVTSIGVGAVLSINAVKGLLKDFKRGRSR
jgi:hypothetical protein